MARLEQWPGHLSIQRDLEVVSGIQLFTEVKTCGQAARILLNLCNFLKSRLDAKETKGNQSREVIVSYLVLSRFSNPESTDWRRGQTPKKMDPGPLHQMYAVAILPVVVVRACSAVSDSLQPYGLQPARLLCSWDFSRQEYWTKLPFPSPGDLPDTEIELTSPVSPALAGGSFTTETPGNPNPSLNECMAIYLDNHGGGWRKGVLRSFQECQTLGAPSTITTSLFKSEHKRAR